VRAVDETAFPGVNATEPDALMLWPTWETGFSDTILKTLLPFADAARRGDVPERAILISGSRFPALWAVNRSVCTFERRERYNEVKIQAPLPRRAREHEHSQR